MTCILEKEDYDLLDTLIRISESIGKLYQNLFQLEVNGKKNSQEYRKNLDYLMIAREVEERLYSDNDMNAIKCSELLKYMLSQKIINNISNNQSIIMPNYLEGKVRRVYNRIENKMHADSKGMISLMEDTKDAEFTIPRDLLELNYSKLILQKNLEKESYLLFLGILFESLPTNLSKYKNNLLNIKYYLSFINTNVEQELLYVNFNIEDKVNVLSNLFAYCNGIDLEEYYLLQNIFGFTNSLQEVYSLLSLNDLNYLDNRYNFQAYVHSCLLRSYLTFLSDLSVLELNKKFNDLLNAKAKEKIKYYISEKIIKECFYNIYVDRNKQVVLKLVH